MKKLQLYDFDKTIYRGDSTIDFYIFCLKKDPLLIRYLPIQFYGMMLYLLKINEKEYFKEKYFSFLKGIKDIDTLVEDFWKENENKIEQNLIDGKENIVIISASPEFLLEGISERIGAKQLIATKTDKNTGKFLSKNCYGKEKVIRLKEIFPNEKIQEFYSDSESDIYLAKLAESSFKVNKGRIEEWKTIFKN